MLFLQLRVLKKRPYMAENIPTPMAKIIPKILEKHGDQRIDNYYWLNDRENPEVIEYLNKENDYYNTITAHTKGFQKELFLEMKARIKEDDASVPYFYNGYHYITRFETGKDYPIYSQKKAVLKLLRKFFLIVTNLRKGILSFSLED